MNKRNLTILSFVTLLCMMLFGTVSCKKDDTLDPNNADFFIDVDFLPESETNGEVAPRLVVNFNDEAAMIELRRPSTGNPMETVLLLCPDHEAMMLCGNDSLMVCASYDMETYTPSHDVLLVTPMDDDALLLTKGFMDWNTNTLATGDMMVLPINDDSRKCGNRNDIDKEMRWFFFNRLIKPIAKSFDKFENFYGAVLGGYGGLVFSYIRTIITTESTILLFADDPVDFFDAMETTVTMETVQGTQLGILNQPVLQDYCDMASRGVAALNWAMNGGHGKVNDYLAETEEGQDFPSETLSIQAYDMVAISTPSVPSPMFIVNLNVGNVTENSAYLKGSYRFGSNSSITPVEMGYIIKVDGNPEHTEYDMNFQGITLSGLQKATKYTAFAYVKSVFGDRVLSPGVSFWTLGFEAFPTSLSFPKEGDTKNVALSYSEQDITHWEVTSKPSWCAVTKDNLGLLAVKVGRTSEARSGTITITAYSNALGSLTEDIAVTQAGSNSWDGTSWSFVGTVTTHNGVDGSSSSNEMALTLVVNSVANKNIEFSYAQILSSLANGYSDNYVMNGNGNLVYSASAVYSGEWGSNQINTQVTFVRTSSTTATANLHYTESVSNVGTITMTGLLQGTLIGDKDIGNYETTVKFNSPIFNNKVLKNSEELR